jgi:integrase/recombinase XerD
LYLQLCTPKPKLTSSDISERIQTFREPKSGRIQETVSLPQKVADTLKDYVKEKSFKPADRIFPICYDAAMAVVKKARDALWVKMKPHDLRRHAATHASRSGVRVEIVSKVIDTEATRRIKNLLSF